MFNNSPSLFMNMPGRSDKSAHCHVTGNHVSHKFSIYVHGSYHPKTHTHHFSCGSIQVVNPTRNRFTSCTYNWKTKLHSWAAEAGSSKHVCKPAMAVLCDVAPCSLCKLIGVSDKLIAFLTKMEGSKLPWNINQYLPDCMLQYHWRHSSFCSALWEPHFDYNYKSFNPIILHFIWEVTQMDT
jgi:hypothetical protein